MLPDAEMFKDRRLHNKKHIFTRFLLPRIDTFIEIRI